MPEPPAPIGEPENNGLDPEAQFKAFLREFYTTEIFPMFEKSQKEALEVQSRDIRSWVVANTKPEDIAKQVVPILSQQLRQDTQPLTDAVNSLIQRVNSLEVRPPPTPIMPSATNNPPAAATESTLPVAAASSEINGDARLKVVAVVETLLDILIEKGLPAWAQIQQSRQMSKLGSMDAATIQEFRTKNPFAAVMLGQALAPDNNVIAMMNQFPYIGANAFAAGIRARHLGPLIAGDPGGNIWPGIPGLGSPGNSPGSRTMPSPVATPPSGRASMQSRRPAAKRPGTRLSTNGASERASRQVKKLSEVVR